MTLQQIFTIIDDNIKKNNGTLRLAPTAISSPEIEKIFTDYLLYKDLVITEASVTLNAGDVSVLGQGNSLVFYKTTIDALVFTVDQNGVPSMTINADANVKPSFGWTFGASFPMLETSNWGGFKDPADEKKWIQYIYFDSGHFTLSKNGLQFRGFLQFVKGLEPLSVLFKGMDKAEVSGAITLNQGTDGWIPSEKTVMPEAKLRVEIGKLTLPIGDFTFTFSFQLVASALIIKTGPKKGMPAPSLEMLIQSTLPINGEEVGVAISVGTITGVLTMRAVLPEDTEIGMPELISLANNSNVLAVLPSNMPVINDFVLKDWQLSFDTKTLNLTQVSIAVGTRKTFSWGLIPRYVTLEEINFTVDVTYFNKTIQPSLTIDGIIGFGDPNAPLRFQISAAFPSYVFMGSYMADPPEVVGGLQPKDLKPVIRYFLGDTIANSLPETLKLAAFDMSIDPKNATYSASAALITDLEIPLGITTVTITQVSFLFDYVAGSASGNISGDFKIGVADDSPVFNVTAGYDSEKSEWSFAGALAEGSKINLKEIIDRYLPAEYHQFNILNITIDKLSLTFNKGVQKRYEFLLSAYWIIELGLGDDPKISASVKVAFDSEKPVGKQYAGYIEGSLNFGNIKVGAKVDFKEGSKDYTFFLNGFQAKLTHNTDNDSIICFNVTDNTSLGDVIALLVNAATGQDITLPAPWNVLNNIKLKDFSFSFNITKKKIGLSYKPSINFGFIKIDEITLYYTYGGAKPLVELTITQGSFLGGAQPLPKPWNVLDPSTTPQVPGKGTQLFRLDFLGMGQHVSLKNGLNPNSVSEAVKLLKDNFEKKATGLVVADKSPIGETGLRFNSNSNWLIGTEFVILETFNLGIVFFDPDVYGLAIYVNGPKAKVFQGLKFEILYKKVTDTVGVYQIYLKLPDSIRQLDFGSVSVTLPSIRLYIYTNGDFKVDFGFPLNDNFSESFGLQMLPFMGSGGFYFGVLSASTATTVPQTTKGNFSPVIVFGIGLRVGIGKEINKGILKAGLSLTVQGVLEGTFAQYNSFDGGNEDVMYYYILGKIAIVGHLYGAINFAIISAELDIRLFISARIVLETAEPILLTFEAGVSVSLKVKVNLGIFSFSISLSFSATVRESFTIGKSGYKPWKQSLSMPFRMPALRALDAKQDCLFVPLMNWKPIVPDTKIELPMLYVPQMSVAETAEIPGQSPRLTAMLYLETSIDQPLVPINPPGVGEEEDLPFTKFAKGVFLWTLGAYLNKTGEGMKVDEILNTPIKSQSLSEILCYFNVEEQLQPFAAKDILAFMEQYLNVTITVPPRIKTDEKQASIFPMLPILSFVTPSGTVYFSDEKAKYTYDATQLELIRNLLRELSVRAGNNQSAPAANVLDEEVKQSLASYMLVDYVALLAKESIQRAIDAMAAHVMPAPANKSLRDLVEENKNYGISAKELAFANRTRPLNAGVGLRVKGIRYTVKEGDTTDALLHRFNIQKDELLRVNSFRKVTNINPCAITPLWTEVQQSLVTDEKGGLLPGSILMMPDIVHTTSANRVESLLSVANHYAVNVHSLIEDNIDIPGLFQTGKNIRVPFVEEMLVKDLLKAMQDNHDFEHMAGLSANIMLQGLRVPLPAPDSKIGKPEALYVVTGQEIAAMPQVGEELSLALETALTWLHLGTPGGTSVPFVIEPQDVTDLQSLAGTTLTPRLLKLQALDLFNIQAKRYTLPSYVEWTTPQAIQLANGSNYLQQTIDPSIWAFKNNLQSLITGLNAIKPKVALLRQVQETVNLLADPTPVQNYSWSTNFNVQLRQVRKAEAPTELMPNVYEVQGIDQGSMSLLRDLVDYYGKNPGAAIIDEIQFLYTKDPAQQGQDKPATGLKSDSIANTTAFLLQTNLSTLSNPSPMLQRLVAGVPGEQPNLLGMKQIEFLRFLWEAAIVGTGGYYFYYQVNDSKAGLPDYLFNDDKDAVITLLITYKITDNVLQNFLNSVVIRDKIDITGEILYIETIGKATVAGEAEFDNKIDVKVATVPSGSMGFDLKRKNPALRTDVNQVEKDLEELYNLLEFNIGPNNDFNATAAGLPVAPGNRSFKAPKDPDVRVRPTSLSSEDWEYERIVRVFPFIKTSTAPVIIERLLAHDEWKNLLSPNDIPPENENPYRATGRSVKIEMRWVDIFGNLTGFTNTSEPGVPTELPPFTMGYIDPVIGLDQYPSITAAYIIQQNENSQPELRVTLAFNPSKYKPANEEDIGWKERVIADREAYKNIYYQLVQPDVTLTVTNSLQNNTANVVGDPKETLLGFVLEIYQYLGSLLGPLSIITGKELEVPANKYFVQPISDNNPLPLFALVTSLTISRNESLVDKNFKDEPSVISATSIAGPDLRKNIAGSAVEDEQITIQEFARKLETAFPRLKVASGLSQTAAEKDSSIDIWLMRFDKAANGIHFSIPNKNKPFYFALQPLSTFLLSRESVLVYPYTSGKPLYESVPKAIAVNGVDLEKIAEAFLNAVDVFLQADFSIPAWKIENAPPVMQAAGEVDIPHPYQHIINAKKDLAKNISQHLSAVLADGNVPDEGNLKAAKERLEQQLLIRLSDAYSIDTVLQFNVDVQSPYKDSVTIAPNLFGKVLDPADASTPDQKAYAFSTTRFSLQQSANPQRSYLSILFNTKKENLKAADSSYFPINLNYEINSVEHDIHGVTGIPDYKSSSWLNFILPFTHESTELGNLKIPIPLRAYPTSPSLTAQRYIAHCPQFNQQSMLSLQDEDKLAIAKAWDYEYSYDYLRAQQDTIYTDILLNIKQGMNAGLFKDDTDPDLLAALLQFSNAYPAIQADLNRYLPGQSNPAFALTAMKSFAWLAGRVAKAWGSWTEQKKLYEDFADGDGNHKYQVVEDQLVIDKDTVLAITVTPREGTVYSLPDIYVPGYEMHIQEQSAQKKIFVYYQMVNGEKVYLTPSVASGITARSIRFNGFNIIQEENAWSGLSIVRNKILVPGIPTNDDFIYETPVIRFVNVLTPLLDPDIDINMAVYTSPGKHKLQEYISNFFTAFFEEIKNKTTTRVVKTAVSYSYTLNEDPDGLRVDIPISMTTPYSFNIPADWNVSNCPDAENVTPQDSFACQLSALLNTWFGNNRPLATNGKLQFDVSLFASLSDSQLPVLHIRRITLDINIVDLG